MSDKPEAEVQDQPAPRKRRVPMLAVIIAGVALGEALLFFVAIKMFGGGPQTTYGDERSIVHGPDPSSERSEAEVPLLSKFRVPNSMEGRTWIYELDLVVTVAAHRKGDLERLRDERIGAISDGVAGIIRSLEPRTLNEPDLRTLRAQIQRALGEVAGDRDLIHQVLIPRCVPMRAP